MSIATRSDRDPNCTQEDSSTGNLPEERLLDCLVALIAPVVSSIDSLTLLLPSLG
jgi:hypothetical protein